MKVDKPLQISTFRPWVCQLIMSCVDKKDVSQKPLHCNGLNIFCSLWNENVLDSPEKFIQNIFQFGWAVYLFKICYNKTVRALLVNLIKV